MSGVSLIVPTLNAEKEIAPLLDAVFAQTIVPDEVLVIDSSSDDKTLEVAASYSSVRTMTIKREDFDHGGTRQLALGNVQGEFVLFLTQDAVPANKNYVECLLRPFLNSSVGMVSGRQVPKPDARRYVQLVQEYNYPSVSNIRVKEDVRRLGIKAFFASDTCSAYRRAAVEKIGGIPRPCSTNEDMLAAARMLRANFAVAYAADACVLHSHNLTLRDQYRRNKAVGQFLAEHTNELGVPSEVGEGVELVRHVFGQLFHEGCVGELLAFGIDCGARLMGNRAGRANCR